MSLKFYKIRGRKVQKYVGKSLGPINKLLPKMKICLVFAKYYLLNASKEIKMKLLGSVSTHILNSI